MRHQIWLYCCLLLPSLVLGETINNVTNLTNVMCFVSYTSLNEQRTATVSCFDNTTLPFTVNGEYAFGCLEVCLNCNLTFTDQCISDCCQNGTEAQSVQCEINSDLQACNKLAQSNCSANIVIMQLNKIASIFYNNITTSVSIATVTPINSMITECSNIMKPTSTILTSSTINSITTSSVIVTVSTSSADTSSTTTINAPPTTPPTTSHTSTILTPSSFTITTSSTSSPSITSAPIASIAAGAAAGGGIILILVFISIIICCVVYIKRRRKSQAIYEMRNRTASHNYVTRTTTAKPTEGPAATNGEAHQTVSTAIPTTIPQSFIRSTPLPEVPPESFSGVPSVSPSLVIKDNPLYSSVDEDLLKFKRWKSVFASIIVTRENVTITEEALGEGAFGKVYKGSLKLENAETNVAIKTLKSNPSSEQVEEFISESAVMLDFDHPNVLKLLGVCFDTEDQLPVIILPYMANGDLKSFLRNHRKQPNVQYNQFPEGLTHSKLLYMCLDIAKGMEYLARKKFVHRDLAARNCVIDGNLIVHVADFGLSRDVYSRDYYRMGIKAAKLPVKWMPPESLNDGIYDEKTDVWSFGVTCWEIFSLGRSPYPAIDNAEIPDYIESGHRLKKPSLCKQELYLVMLSCWELDPANRATFSQLVSSICSLLREEENDEGTLNDYFTLEETSAAVASVIMKQEEMNNLTKMENNENESMGIDLSLDILSAQPYTDPLTNDANELEMSFDMMFPQPYSLPVNEHDFMS